MQSDNSELYNKLTQLGSLKVILFKFLSFKFIETN